jgi:hypothetical protein
MKLEIILRTCDRGNISKFPRFIDVSKAELVLGCVASLINAANQVVSHHIHFKILDDNSSQETLHQLQSLFSNSKHSYEFVKLSGTGSHYTALKQFELCRDSNADLVYSVEDDYLHCPTALKEALEEFNFLQQKYPIEKPLCLFLWDQPEDYEAKHLSPELIMRGKYRHWKTGWFTTYSFITSPMIFQQYWNLFETLATQYQEWNGTGNKNDTIHEGNTICKIWETDVMRINPISSLTLHMQGHLQEDSYINWREWWKHYTTIEKSKLNYI